MKWRTMPLEAIKSPVPYAFVGGPFGSNLTTRDYVEDGVPVIRGNNLPIDSLFREEDFVFVSEKKASDLRPNTALPGDLVFTQRGTLGQVGLIPREARYQRYIISQSQMKLTVNPEIACAHFVYYLFRQPSMVQKVINYAITSGVPHINLGILKKFKITLPEIDCQKGAAGILSAYDDLIDTNRRRIQLLEEAARLLFREWFVCFRFPLRLRSGQAGQEKVKIVDGMPEGWRKRRLVEVADIVMGQSPKSEYYNDSGEGLPFHQGVTGFGNRYPTNQTYCTQKNRMAQAGDILFSVRAPVGRINISTEKIIIGRGISAVRSKENHQSYLFYELKNHFFKEDMIGGGAIFAAITKKDLETVVITYPDEKTIEQFENITNPIDRQIEILSIQNQKLAQARDLLLPRLMSGAIEV
jgi:type I restriction enzyme S subunit